MAQSRKSKLSMSIDTPASHAHWLTWAALAIALILMIVRLTTSEALREPWAAAVGGTNTPRGPGPGVGVVLDALAYLPALLVLARRALDRSFRLTPRLSHVPLALLIGWTALSTLWSADQYAAVVSASHLCAAAAVLWAVSQIAASGASRRLVAGICFGMLLLLSVQLLLYRYIDVPADVRYWTENKTQILHEHNWDADSFMAKQLEHKLLNGETVSFFTSPNSLAAVGVMLMAVAAAAGVQRVRDGDGPQWWGLTAAAGAAAAWILLNARSKTSIGTPILGVAIFLVFVQFRQTLRLHSKRAYLAGVVTAVMAVFAVIGHGMYHHGLFPGHFSNSLDFRWKYWVASSKLVVQKPIVGVGFANFGSHYLSVRLPDAVEEIQDPHNVLVRFAVETGLVGLALLLAWLARVAWEVTRPAKTLDEPKPAAVSLITLALIPLLGIVISTFINVDLSQGVADVALELMRRLLFGLVLIAGTLLVTMRTPHQTQADDRTAPWIFYGIVIALVLFFVHNLIDFSFFEPGAMLASLLLCGVVLAMPQPDAADVHHRPAIAFAGLGAAAVGWIVFVLLIVVPILSADLDSKSADEAIRANNLTAAAASLQSAMTTIPYNSDYVERAASTQWLAGRGDLAEPLVDRAIAMNPMQVNTYLLRTQLEMSKPSPSAQRILADFDRITAINPNDVTLHAQYGHALDHFGRPAEAAKQYRRALAANAALGPDEPRRMKQSEVDELTAAAARDEQMSR